MMENIDKLIMSAMKNHNDEEVRVYRLIKAEFLKFEKSGKFTEWTDALKLQILNKMAQQRKDSISQYEKANRDDLVQVEKVELDIINKFLPKEPTKEELIEEIDALIAEMVACGSAVNLSKMKYIMGVVKMKFPLVDGKLLSSLIKERL